MTKTQITCLSDSHTQHDKIALVPGRVLIHAGDFSSRGREEECILFLKWFEAQPFEHRIFTVGNHEVGVETNHARFLELVRQYAPTSVYLNDSGITIDGVSYWGSPFSPKFGWGWAFNADRGADIKRHWDMIPKNTNVLITHSPAYEILDEVMDSRKNQGCRDLADTIKTLLDLKLHVFGHLHLCGGQRETRNGVVFANAAIVDEDYCLTRKPLIIEIEC